MPTYEYVCEKCGHEFEIVQSMSAKPLKHCPKDACAQKKWGRGKVKKKVSAGGGLLFKGSGFYITDYRSKNYQQGAKQAAGETKPAAAAKAETKPAVGESKAAAPPKTETKPAPKAEKK
jgi:putative FmdB family regulatory protein